LAVVASFCRRFGNVLTCCPALRACYAGIFNSVAMLLCRARSQGVLRVLLQPGSGSRWGCAMLVPRPVSTLEDDGMSYVAFWSSDEAASGRRGCRHAGNSTGQNPRIRMPGRRDSTQACLSRSSFRAVSRVAAIRAATRHAEMSAILISAMSACTFSKFVCKQRRRHVQSALLADAGLLSVCL
jgi:hypothetical protein